MSSASPARLSAHLLLALTALLWAAHWIVARAVVPHVTPVAMAFWRWAFAIAILAPFAWPHLRRDRAALRAGWKAVLFFGTCGTVLYNAIGYMGIAQTTATNAVLLQSVTPGMIPLAAWALFGERISARTALGLAISFSGVLAIVARLDPGALGALQVARGDLWLLANVLLWSIYTVCLRWRPSGLHPLSFMLAVMLAGMAGGIPAYALDLAAGGHTEWRTGVVLGILYLAVFPSILCYLMWERGVAEIGAARAGAYLHLIPLAGSLMAIAFLGERLRLHHAAGIALILAGVTIVSRGRR
jgi:drug/metabolite transporter (DMT)-like permease